MSDRPKLTVAEYLAIERRAETRSEYYRGEVYPLGPASFEHDVVKENLVGKLRPQVKDGRFLVTDRRLQLGPDGTHAYPDIAILAGPAGQAVDARESVADPQIIIEILDQTAQGNEYGWKYHSYMQAPSVREYVLVSIDEMRVVRFARELPDTWRINDFLEPNGEFALATLPVRIAMRDIYAGTQATPVE